MSEDSLLAQMKNDALDMIKNEASSLLSELEVNFKTQSSSVLGRMIEVYENFEKALSSVKLEEFSKFVVESRLCFQNLRKQVSVPSGLPVDELTVVEFLLLEILQSVQNYCDFIAKNGSDDPAYSAEKTQSLKLAKEWAPSGAASAGAVPEIKHVQSEPVAESLTNAPAQQMQSSVEKSERQGSVKENSKNGQHLLFSVGTLTCTIPIENVVEVIQWRNLEGIPSLQGDLLGVINHHGDIIPVKDLFNVEHSRNIIVIMNVDEGLLGISASDAKTVIDIKTHSPQEFSQKTKVASTMQMSGVIILENKPVYVLEPNLASAA